MKVFLENETDLEALPSDVLEKIGDSVLQYEGQNPQEIAVGVYYVDKDRIKALNSEYRNKDKDTDVITFRLLEGDKTKITRDNLPYDFDEAIGAVYIGEIFICLEVAKEQATTFAHSFMRETAELFVHGMLHILWHDHEEEGEKAKMRASEEAQFSLLDKLIKE